MTRAFMLEQLTLIELDPLAFIDVAERSGYDGIGLHMEGLSFPRSARYSLIEDQALRTAFGQRLTASGLKLHVIEPFVVTPETDRDALRRNLDIAVILGAAVAGTLSFDPDASRGADSMAMLSADAAERGLALSIEPYYHSCLPTLSAAQTAARAAGASAGVTLDVLHVVRGDEHWSTMPDFDPALVRSVQLSDGPLDAPESRVAEAIADRSEPGDGAFDLASLVPLLPDHLPIGIEVPQANALLPPLERAIQLREKAVRLFT